MLGAFLCFYVFVEQFFGFFSVLYLIYFLFFFLLGEDESAWGPWKVEVGRKQTSLSLRNQILRRKEILYGILCCSHQEPTYALKYTSLFFILFFIHLTIFLLLSGIHFFFNMFFFVLFHGMFSSAGVFNNTFFFLSVPVVGVVSWGLLGG